MTAPPLEKKALPSGPEVKALPPAKTQPPRRRGRALLWLLLIGGLSYAGYSYYQTAQRKKAAAAADQARRAANRAVTVAAAPVRTGDIPVYLRGLGTVTAYNTVNVKTRVDGPIVKVNFREGQMVSLGEQLVEIDPRPFQVALEQAQGQLARDEAQLKDAQVNTERYRKLWEAGVIAKQQYDTQSATAGQFEGSIKMDQANIDSAKLNLSFTNVTSPIAGRIGLRQVDIGNIVHAADPNPIAIITQMQPIAVLFTIPADSLPPVLTKLHAGVHSPVEAYDRADLNKIASGVLETVDNQIDTNTGTSRLKAIFQNEQTLLFPNQFVNCRLLLDTKRRINIVPTAAVQRGPQGPYVYVIKPDGTATMRTVTVGITEGLDEEITSGVAAGETVVTDGQDRLQEGSHVTVQRPGGPPAGTPMGNPQGNTPSGGGRRGGRKQ
jgi:multidrug efflux system membrane fusion protein